MPCGGEQRRTPLQSHRETRFAGFAGFAPTKIPESPPSAGSIISEPKCRIPPASARNCTHRSASATAHKPLITRCPVRGVRGSFLLSRDPFFAIEARNRVNVALGSAKSEGPKEIFGAVQLGFRRIPVLQAGPTADSVVVRELAVFSCAADRCYGGKYHPLNKPSHARKYNGRLRDFVRPAHTSAGVCPSRC